MAQIQTGTVSITQNTNTVTGVGTTWVTSGVQVGDSFKVTGVAALYGIIAVDSETQIRISPNYAGTTVSGGTYQITSDFTPNLGLAEISNGDSEFAFHMTHEVIRKLDSSLGNVTNESKATMFTSPTFTGTVTAPIYSAVANTTVHLNPNYNAGYAAVQVQSNHGLQFATNNQTRATISAAGNVLIGTTTDNGLAKLQTTNGITLGNSANANPTVLDWYEEKDWSSTLNLGRTSIGNITAELTKHIVRATRIGRLVTLEVMVEITSITSQGTGYLVVTGLPWAPGNSYASAGVVGINTAFSATAVEVAYAHTDGGGTIYFKQPGRSNILLAEDWAVGILSFTLTYSV